MISWLARGFRASVKLLDKKGYYRVLEISNQATDVQIKAAYFSLAKQIHPDVNKTKDAGKKFAKLSEAFEILKNPESRAIYDSLSYDEYEPNIMSSEEAFPNVKTEFEFNFEGEEVSEKNEEDHKHDSEDFYVTPKESIRRAEEKHINLTLEISYGESVSGVKKQVKVNRMTACEVCKGCRVTSEALPTKCQKCKGKGMISKMRGLSTVQARCSVCNGAGSLIQNYCIACDGRGLTEIQEVETIKIPRRTKTGKIIVIEGKGRVKGVSWMEGDLLVHIRVTPKE